jgi:hypothetical protein
MQTVRGQHTSDPSGVATFFRHSIESMAEAYYSARVKELTSPKVFGLRATRGDELEAVARRLLGKHFAGVFAADTVRITQARPWAIVNTDSSSHSGEHWFALALQGNGNVIGYDSYGRSVASIAMGGLPGLRIRNTDPDAEQTKYGRDKDTCGPRCIAWLQTLKALGPAAALRI